MRRLLVALAATATLLSATGCSEMNESGDSNTDSQTVPAPTSSPS